MAAESGEERYIWRLERQGRRGTLYVEVHRLPGWTGENIPFSGWRKIYFWRREYCIAEGTGNSRYIWAKFVAAFTKI